MMMTADLVLRGCPSSSSTPISLSWHNNSSGFAPAKRNRRVTFVTGNGNGSHIGICMNRENVGRRPITVAQSGFNNNHDVTRSSSSSSFALLVGGAVFALAGLGSLRFCKPAFAENVVPSTLIATLNDKGQVQLQDSSTASESETRPVGEDPDTLVEAAAGTPSSVDEAGAEEFSPPYGEGSDLTNDPAELLLRSYLENHPADMKALQALLFLRLKKGEVDSSLSVLKTLIELEPENLEWKYIRAQAYEYAGDLPQARLGFQEVLESKPLSARALQGLAVVLHKMGDEEEAVQILMDAVKKADDAGKTKEATNLKMLLGQLHTMQGDLDKAMELYKTVVEEDPEDYRPYLCQGLIHSIIGEEAEAEKQFRLYRKYCPEDFAHRGFLDDLMLKAKSESRMLKKRVREEKELKMKGQKVPSPMRQPLASGTSPVKDSKVGS